MPKKKTKAVDVLAGLVDDDLHTLQDTVASLGERVHALEPRPWYQVQYTTNPLYSPPPNPFNPPYYVTSESISPRENVVPINQRAVDKSMASHPSNTSCPQCHDPFRGAMLCGDADCPSRRTS